MKSEFPVRIGKLYFIWHEFSIGTKSATNHSFAVRWAEQWISGGVGRGSAEGAGSVDALEFADTGGDSTRSARRERDLRMWRREHRRPRHRDSRFGAADGNLDTEN